MSATTITAIEAGEILAYASAKKAAGWRLVECHANRPFEDDKVEVEWTFSDDENLAVEMYRAKIDHDQHIESVSHLFPCAFVFENEMHDLYGVQIDGILIDFQGGFYHVHYDAPMMSRPDSQARK